MCVCVCVFCSGQGGDSILIHSVKGGQLEVVRALLDKYVDVDVQGSVSMCVHVRVCVCVHVRT